LRIFFEDRVFVNCSFFLRLLTDDAEFKKKFVSKDEKQKEQREKKAKQEEQMAVAEHPHCLRVHSIKLSLTQCYAPLLLLLL
jgi:hypothetical protein